MTCRDSIKEAGDLNFHENFTYADLHEHTKKLLNLRNTLFIYQNGFNNKPNLQWRINVFEVLRLSQEERRELLQKKKSVVRARGFRSPSEVAALPQKNSICEYFYHHLNNYTKTVIRLRLVDIGEYSLRFRRIIVK